MQGQWGGGLKGENPGTVIVDIDHRGDHYTGTAYFYDAQPGKPDIFARIKTSDLSTHQELVAPIEAFSRSVGGFQDPEVIAASYPTVEISGHAEISLRLTNGKLHVGYKTNLGTSAEGILENWSGSPTSTILRKSDIKTWEEFRAACSRSESVNYIFRGQSKPWSLKTSFHRSGRYDLMRYLTEDFQEALFVATPLMSQLLDVNNPLHRGAFYNLLQHHGYPTPLLDWTSSPFIAAFFAFNDALNAEAKENDCIRIFVLKRSISKTTPQSQHYVNVLPHISVSKYMAIGNSRWGPQQSIHTLTNASDIERLIAFHETQSNEAYLSAIDLPMSEAEEALADLDLMGISAASVFPGLDGALAALKQRRFSISGQNPV